MFENLHLELSMIGFNLTWTAIIVSFAALDLLFRWLIHQEIDSIAADVIIFSNVTIWYDIYLRASEMGINTVHILTVTKLLLLLVLMVLFFIYHGIKLLRLNKEHVSHEFKILSDIVRGDQETSSECIKEKEELLKKIESYALANTHINITKDYLKYWHGNWYKERSRAYLIDIIKALKLPTSENMFLLEKKSRRNYALICLGFGILAIVLSSIYKIGYWVI